METWTVNGKCPCGGTYEDRVVEVRLAPTPDRRATVLSSVPQGVCPSCGSRVYHASTLQRIEVAYRLAAEPVSVVEEDEPGSGTARVTPR